MASSSFFVLMRSLAVLSVLFLVSHSAMLGNDDTSGMDPIQRTLAKRSAHRTASVNGSKVLECDIPYPGKIYLDHIITWRKQGIEVPIFIQFNGFPPHCDTKYLGRVRLVEKASIELKNILPSDEGWYECSIVFLDGTDRSNQNGTWVYLSVHKSTKKTSTTKPTIGSSTGATATGAGTTGHTGAGTTGHTGAGTTGPTGAGTTGHTGAGTTGHTGAGTTGPTGAGTTGHTGAGTTGPTGAGTTGHTGAGTTGHTGAGTTGHTGAGTTGHTGAGTTGRTGAGTTGHTGAGTTGHTESPKKKSGSKFDVGSFFGGILLALGIVAIAIVAYVCYTRHHRTAAYSRV